MTEEDLEWEINATFVDKCTCEHEEMEHDWGNCGVIDDDTEEECDCEAGWEE